MLIVNIAFWHIICTIYAISLVHACLLHRPRLAIYILIRDRFEKTPDPVLIYHFILLALAPGRSPSSVQLYAINSTSVRVRWSPVRRQNLHGNLRGYQVAYEDVVSGRNFIVNTDEDLRGSGSDQALVSCQLFTFCDHFNIR